jgi:hypothetical protein
VKWLLLTSPLQRQWNPDSTVSPEEQRGALVRSFLKLESIPVEWTTSRDRPVSREPTETEIREILEPWRPAKLRKTASYIWRRWDYQLIILRTYYDDEGDGDGKMQEWLETDEEEDMFFDPDSLWWRILDDRDLFNFGSNWEAILGILPELVGRQGLALQARPKMKPKQVAEALQAEDPTDELQFLAFNGPTPLLVADKEAFEENLLRVIFLDAYGNAVRYSEVKPKDMAWLKQDGEEVRLQGSSWWQNGEVGDEYEEDGDMMRAWRSSLSTSDE